MEIKERGYQSLRAFIVEDWNKAIIRNANNTKVYEKEGLNWVHPTTTENKITGYTTIGQPKYEDVTVQSSPNLEFEFVIKGSDVVSDATAVKLELYDSNDEVVSEEEFEPFTFSNIEDELTITHTIEVPRA